MSGYPDANYPPMPTYVYNIGESCDNPCPYTYYDGGTFCSDVTINASLSVSGDTATGTLTVGGKLYKPVLMDTLLGSFLVLATPVL